MVPTISSMSVVTSLAGNDEKKVSIASSSFQLVPLYGNCLLYYRIGRHWLKPLSWVVASRVFMKIFSGLKRKNFLSLLTYMGLLQMERPLMQ